MRLYGNINSRLRRLLCRPYTDHTPFPSPRHGGLFRPSLACLFRQLRFLTRLTVVPNSDKESWNLLLSMFSLPFGLSPCQFLSFLRHRQPFLQLTVHPVSGLNRSGGIFVLRCPCAFPDTVSGVSPLSFYILSPPSTSNPFMRSFHFSDKSDIHFPLQS